jgi:hypothetical protein
VILFLPSSTLVQHNSKERGRRWDRRSRHQGLSRADYPKEASTMLCLGDGQARNQATSWLCTSAAPVSWVRRGRDDVLMTMLDVARWWNNCWCDGVATSSEVSMTTSGCNSRRKQHGQRRTVRRKAVSWTVGFLGELQWGKSLCTGYGNFGA